MQVLNFDAFTTVKRQLKFKGVSHDVHEMDVEQFINGLAEEDARAKEDAARAEPLSELQLIARQTEDAVKVVEQAIPTVPKEDLKKMKLAALQTVVAFIRGGVVTDGEGNVVTASAADKAAEEASEKKPS